MCLFIPQCGAPRKFWERQVDCLMILPRDFIVIQQFIVEAGWCRKPYHYPLDHARDFKVILQGFQNFCFLQLHGLPDTCSSRASSHTQLTASIIDLNLKIL